MLKRIKIRGYKSLVDLDVSLEPLCVIFGPNAAGKSNFLDALQLLSRLATSSTIREAFQPPYRGALLESFSFGAGGISSILSQDTVSFSIEADLELSQNVIDNVNREIQEMRGRSKVSDNGNGDETNSKETSASVREKYLRYRIEIEVMPKSGILRVADEYLSALTKDGEPTKSRRPFLERVENRIHLRMEGQSHPTYYERYLPYSMLSRSHHPPHYPHLVAVRQELSNWLFFYFEPRERMRAPNAVKEVRHIGLMGEELAAFLNTLRVLDERQFHAVEKALHIVIPSITGIDVGVNALGEVELRLLEGDIPIPARVVSEGTLRILGLLALVGAKEPPSLLAFEEPENGIHPRRIRLIADFLRERTLDTQVIVTTHSSILPDLIPDNFLYACRKRRGHTEIISFADLTLPLWREGNIASALDDEEEPLSVSSRILRGDFDA